MTTNACPTDSVPGAAGRLPAELPAPPAPAPVFVDVTGRRRRLVRRLGALAVVGCFSYLPLVATAVLGGSATSREGTAVGQPAEPRIEIANQPGVNAPQVVPGAPGGLGQHLPNVAGRPVGARPTPTPTTAGKPGRGASDTTASPTAPRPSASAGTAKPTPSSSASAPSTAPAPSTGDGGTPAPAPAPSDDTQPLLPSLVAHLPLLSGLLA